MLAVLLALVLAAPAAAATPPLERYAPVVVHDSREEDPLASVEALAGRVPGVPDGPVTPTVYARRAGPWLQYWMFFADNPHDRGVLRTGRHEGDWELVQYRLGRDGEPVRAVYSQHAGAERCAWEGVRTAAGGRPLVFLARGAHAAYFVPGVRDRTWPDPNDEADGKGARVRPRVVRITEDAPPWMRFDGRWGATRAGWVPGEMDAPRGPAFQPQGRWDDPDRWAAGAKPCLRARCDEVGECDRTETTLAAVGAGGGVVAALLYLRRRIRPRRADRSGATG